MDVFYTFVSLTSSVTLVSFVVYLIGKLFGKFSNIHWGWIIAIGAFMAVWYVLSKL